MAKDIMLVPEWVSNMRAMMVPGGLIKQLQGNSAYGSQICPADTEAADHEEASLVAQRHEAGWDMTTCGRRT